MTSKVCPNCQLQLLGNYCSNCGQKYIAVPYSFRNVRESLLSLLDFNRKFFVTLFFLYTKPNIVVHSYLGGNTKKFCNPFKYFAILMALIGIIILANNLASDDANSSSSLFLELRQFLILLPVLLINSLFNFLFIRNDKNYLEHFIIASYHVPQFFILFILSVTLTENYSSIQYKDSPLPVLMAIPITLLYHIWFNNVVFKRRFYKTTLLSLLSFILIFLILGTILVMNTLYAKGLFWKVA